MKFERHLRIPFPRDTSGGRSGLNLLVPVLQDNQCISNFICTRPKVLCKEASLIHYAEFT